MDKEFTKDDLQADMVVVLRNGSIMRVKNVKNGIFIVDKDDCWNSLNDYSDDLKVKGVKENLYKFDIVLVYGFSILHSKTFDFSTEYRELLWKRKEELTADEQIKQMLEDYKESQSKSTDELLKMIKEKLEEK